jgi:hypothetical protein
MIIPFEVESLDVYADVFFPKRHKLSSARPSGRAPSTRRRCGPVLPDAIRRRCESFDLLLQGINMALDRRLIRGCLLGAAIRLIRLSLSISSRRILAFTVEIWSFGALRSFAESADWLG